MNNNHLHNHLNALHNEVEQAEVDNTEAQKMLDTLSENIQNILEHPGDISFDHHRILMNNLENSLVHFEVSHPTLTPLINHVIMSLNSLGI